VPGKLIPSLLGVGLPQLDLRVAAFGGGTVLIAALCAGVIPAWRASRLALLDGLQAGGQRIAGSGGQRPVRRIFQALQIALTLVLLVCAGLFVRSVFQMVNIPTGFDPAGLAYVELGFPPQSFAIQSQRVAFAEQMVSRLSVMPGVQGVTVGPPPVSNLTTMRRWEPDGDSTRAVDMTTRLFWVAPDYFRVAGIRLTEGRTFGSQNGDTGEQVVIISENAARRLWPGRSAVGGRLRSGQQVYTVVGVVPHLRTLGFTDDGAELFYPITQRDVGGTGLLMRVTEKSAAVASVRALARALDSRVTIKRIGTVNQLFADSDPFGSPGFYAVLLGALAGLGLLTASVGLYGLMSFAVSQRAHEIGVRIALGADSASVRRLLIGDALAPVALGIIVGLVAATWLSKFVASQLFRVTPHDLTTFSVIVVLLVLVCGLALSRPVRRAAHIAPVDALRHE
jgi:predicted permease